MLKNIYIKNFAIIDEIDVKFSEGLTAITGETGAGKSILMGALSLVMGDRADSSLIKSNTDKCIIEAVFDIKNIENAKKYLQKYEFESEQELIIRREINTNGKSRIFINDTPTTLAILLPLSNLLLDLHRQFDTIELQQQSYQLDIVDSVANLQKEMLHFENQFLQWKKAEKEYEQIVESNKKINQELDYFQFNFNELDVLNIQSNEIEHAENELTILQNAESYKQSLQQVSDILYNSDSPILTSLKQTIQLLEPHTKINHEIIEIVRRIQQSAIELKDIQNEVESIFEKVYFDEEKINLLQDRLNELNRLLKKHHAKNTTDLIEIKNDFEQKILQAAQADDTIEKIFLRKNNLEKEVNLLAEKISKSRKNILALIEDNINKMLQKVGMPNAIFKIDINKVALTKTGFDKIDFMLDANKSNSFKPLSKVASGGELSRIMLCIKSLLAHNTALPTLIFDEIDTGISGETAIQVGNIMKQLANAHQLITITHLPQIASKAKQHLYIYKDVNPKGEIHTFIKQLNEDERINTLAEMLSGKESSEQAKLMVKELMK